jgi:hypothetical protein
MRPANIKPLKKFKSASISNIAQSFSTLITPAVFSSMYKRPVSQRNNGLAPETAYSVKSTQMVALGSRFVVSIRKA